MAQGIFDWGAGVLSDLGSDTSFEMRNPLVQDFMSAFEEQDLVGVNRTTADEIRATLLDGMKAGEGIAQLKKRVGDVFDDLKGYRAERIARTEVVGASNAANVAAYQISGLVDGKEWLAVPDDRTRETHAEMDGEVVGISDDFRSPAGYTAQGPGLFGVPEEDINCRCTVIPKLNEKAGPEERAAVWRAYDAALIPWESRLVKALQKGAQVQLEHVLRAMG